MRLTDAERWELRALLAEEKLAILARQLAANRIVSKHGFDPCLPHALNHEDGTITPALPQQE